MRRESTKAFVDLIIYGTCFVGVDIETGEPNFIPVRQFYKESDVHAEMEMPKYKCHKEVWALKIKQLTMAENAVMSDESYVLLTPEDDRYTPFYVSKEYFLKHHPTPGDYYVVYEDGYKSCSPAKVFEDGYTLTLQNPTNKSKRHEVTDCC